jgi:hypothetical protein
MPLQDYVMRGIMPSLTVRMRHPDGMRRCFLFHFHNVNNTARADAPGHYEHLLAECRARFVKRGKGHRTLITGAAEPAPASASNGAGAMGKPC